MKYSEPGTVVAIGSQLHRGQVRLWVRDEGIGIDAGELEVVRERFGRAAEAAAHAPGAGLGLTIVESIVAAHNGVLEIDSEPGRGSTFTMVVPLAAPSPDHPDPDQPDPDQPDPDQPHPEQETGP